MIVVTLADMQKLTNPLLALVAILLVLNLWQSVPTVRAASSKVTIQKTDKNSIEVIGDVVGFSCVNKGAYTECSIASR